MKHEAYNMKHKSQIMRHESWNIKHGAYNTEHESLDIRQEKARRKCSMLHASCSVFYAPCSMSRGFAMLFSVLVSSLVLSVGLSIFTLTLKELVLSSSGRESQFAFYAADSGVECAMYWDIKGTEIFATSSDIRIPDPSNPQCNAQEIIIIPVSSNKIDDENSSATTEFTFSIDPSVNQAKPCVTVTIKKDVVANILSTKIDSRGYNTCNSTDVTRVERALRVTY